MTKTTGCKTELKQIKNDKTMKNIMCISVKATVV